MAAPWCHLVGTGTAVGLCLAGRAGSAPPLDAQRLVGGIRGPGIGRCRRAMGPYAPTSALAAAAGRPGPDPRSVAGTAAAAQPAPATGALAARWALAACAAALEHGHRPTQLPGQWPCARPAVAGPAGGRWLRFRGGYPGRARAGHRLRSERTRRQRPAAYARWPAAISWG